MHQNNLKDCNSSIESIRSRLIDDNSNKSQVIEQHIIINDENTQVLTNTDNEEEFTSSGVSEDDEVEVEDEEEGNMSSENHFEEGNILQPLDQYNHQTNLNNLLNTTQNINVTFIQPEGLIEATQLNNDHIITQTMAVLAAKHRHDKSNNSTPTENEILFFVGPCPLYSLASSFGLDMHHGLSYFPCRDVLANGAGHIPAPPLWQHLTSAHNLNLSSSSLLISHLLLRGYSSPTPILFNTDDTKSILRTTPRYSLFKKCPLTNYGIYGIQFEHGTRLCSGYTYNTNIYSHLISFHKMTHDASLRLSRAIAFNDKKFQFEFNEILINEYNKSPLIKLRRISRIPRLRNNQYDLFKKFIKTKPVKNI